MQKKVTMHKQHRDIYRATSDKHRPQLIRKQDEYVVAHFSLSLNVSAHEQPTTYLNNGKRDRPLPEEEPKIQLQQTLEG